MRILYESDLAGSKYHGMAYRIYQFSREFVSRGHQVMIVAASYSHVRSKNPVVTGLITDEEIDGITYKWIKTNKYKGNGLGRVWHMLSYNIKLFLHARSIAREFKPDIVISSGVTPLDFIGCNRIAKYANAGCILEVGDLWPLTPIELGGFSRRHPFIMFMQKAEDYAYRNTSAVVSLLPCAEEYMKSRGLKENKFTYISNGIVESDWNNTESLPEEHLNVINDLKHKGEFLIGFSGTHSISNALYTMLDVAKKLENDRIHFVLVGGGPIKQDLIDYARKNRICNATFLPAVNKLMIPGFLSMMDALYVGFQKQSLYRFGISPNKIYDYMMSGKPVIQAIEAGNSPVDEAKCGFSVSPDDMDGICGAIVKIKNMSQDERNKLGSNGRIYVKENNIYDFLVKKYLNLLEAVIISRKQCT